jgi:prevent-host-death family protein
MTMVRDYGLRIFEMSAIAAGEFKSKCLQLLDEVAATRKPLVITKFGKPVAQVIPMPPALKLRGALEGSVLFEKDIIAPLENEWEAAHE